MPVSRDTLIGLMLKLEGGYVNNPTDPGGATKYGITQRTLDSLRSSPPCRLPATVDQLTPDAATTIYRVIDWDKIAGDSLPPALAALMLNSAVNQGLPTAVMLLQGIVSVKCDGIMGPGTLAAVQSWRSSYLPEQTLAEEFAARAAVRYARLDAQEDQFELGWFRRLIRVYTLVLTLPPGTT